MGKERKDETGIKVLGDAESVHKKNGGLTEAWKKNLTRDAKGNVAPTMNNFSLIMEKDENLLPMRMNLMTESVEVRGELPWKRNQFSWCDADAANLNLYLEREYGIYSPQKAKEAMTAILCSKRAFHPVKEYLDALRWDGRPRLDHLLVDYLGAPDNAYVHAVTRKTLTAAVARVYEPGIKFDHILILCGEQGVGKSTLFAKLGRGWYSDALTINDMRDKTSAEKLQKVWIMEIPELAGMRRVEGEFIKSFLSRQVDVYRRAYGQFVEYHPRRCIIVGTTNHKDGFLRDITGNRRFWPVNVKGGSVCTVWDLAETDVDQIWAEAVMRFREGEALFLEGQMADFASEAQSEAMEGDPRQGLVEDYLNTMLPVDWEEYDIDERMQYLSGQNVREQEKSGVVLRKRVCLMEIWVECLGKERADMRRTDACELEGILQKIGGWRVYNANTTGKTRIFRYGVQKTFVRTEGGAHDARNDTERETGDCVYDGA